MSGFFTFEIFRGFLSRDLDFFHGMGYPDKKPTLAYIYNFGNMFSRDNPCKAVNTLQSVLLNWTRAYSMNCENTDAAFKWFDRVERHSDKITRKLMRQKSVKNAENCE